MKHIYFLKTSTVKFSFASNFRFEWIDFAIIKIMLHPIASYRQYVDLFLQSIRPIHAQSSRCTGCYEHFMGFVNVLQELKLKYQFHSVSYSMILLCFIQFS